MGINMFSCVPEFMNRKTSRNGGLENIGKIGGLENLDCKTYLFQNLSKFDLSSC
jgi:hypothetical protein